MALPYDIFNRTILRHTPEDIVGKCNTEKSKHVQRKKFRTAGEIVFSSTTYMACGLNLMLFPLIKGFH